MIFLDCEQSWRKMREWAKYTRGVRRGGHARQGERESLTHVIHVLSYRTLWFSPNRKSPAIQHLQFCKALLCKNKCKLRNAENSKRNSCRKIYPWKNDFKDCVKLSMRVQRKSPPTPFPRPSWHRVRRNLRDPGWRTVCHLGGRDSQAQEGSIFGKVSHCQMSKPLLDQVT